MKIGKQLKQLGALALLILSLGSRVFAEPSIQAKVSATEISLSDSVILNIEISDLKDVTAPGNIQLPDFQIQPIGTTRSYQYVNGKNSSLVSYNYRLTPKKTGTLFVPSITLTQNGNQISTDQLSIVVTQDSTAPSSSQEERAVNIPAESLKPLFMTASVSKSDVYVGEQILLTIQFLRIPSIQVASQPRYIKPDMTGFLVEDLKQKDYESNLKGVNYAVTEIRYALFPTSDGDFAIGNSTIDMAVRSQPDPFNANSFFENFFGHSQAVKLNTRAIPIRVRSLPNDKPTTFSGAVGRFSINASVDNKSLEVGKPFNLVLTFEGVGNINGLKEPELPDLVAFRKYETIAKGNVVKDGQLLNGSKEFKILLIPQVSGQVSIPAIPYSYFDPDSRQFKTLATKRIDLNVAPGEMTQNGQDQIISTTQTGQISEGVRIVEKDIRFIKNGKVSKIKQPIYQNIAFFILNGLPPLFALGAAIVVFRSRRKIIFADSYRSKGAFKKAARILKGAKKHIDDESAVKFIQSISRAFNEYMGDKFGLSAAGLTWTTIETELNRKLVSPELKDKIKEILNSADYIQFTAGNLTKEERVSKLTESKLTLAELDKKLS